MYEKLGFNVGSFPIIGIESYVNLPLDKIKDQVS
jgi:hypothetical protein